MPVKVEIDKMQAKVTLFLNIEDLEHYIGNGFIFIYKEQIEELKNIIKSVRDIG